MVRHGGYSLKSLEGFLWLKEASVRWSLRLVVQDRCAQPVAEGESRWLERRDISMP